MVLPTISFEKEMTGELEKIREKYLTIKDFQQNRSIERSLPDCYGRGYLRISVEVNCKSKDYKVLHSEIV